MDLNKFKQLLSIPSKTYQEEDMVEYLCSEMDKINGVSYYKDGMMNIYATKGELLEGEFYPMFIAHTDTVHSKVDKIIVKEENLIRPNTFGKSFDDIEVVCLKAYTEDGGPTGIGGDDKCGIFICLELLKQLDKVKIGLFVSEETGCHGSSKCDETFLKDVGYITQYDAPGNHLISESCSGVRLFERDGEFFKKTLKVIEESFKNEMLIQSHPYTDIMQLKKKSDVSCINMSCGYYNMHSNQEFISIEDVKCSIEAGKNMVKELGYKKYEFKHKEPIKSQTFFDFDNSEDVSFYDDIHQLRSIDIVEEEDGFIIADIYDENNFFIDDEDGYKLYEILKNRYIKNKR
jgi:putative aminopeptidase FrvX